MPGITRIIITDKINGNGAWRFEKSSKYHAAANELYRDIFSQSGMTIAPGYQEMRRTSKEHEAGYDKYLGIDVVFELVSGQQITMQEKFLFTDFYTVTVEYWQDWRTQEPGDWFNMRCQYYFTGYSEDDSGTLDPWILLNWANVMQATALNLIPWEERQNTRDGARSSFKYAPISKFPQGTFVARKTKLTLYEELLQSAVARKFG